MSYVRPSDIFQSPERLPDDKSESGGQILGQPKATISDDLSDVRPSQSLPTNWPTSRSRPKRTRRQPKHFLEQLGDEAEKEREGRVTPEHDTSERRERVESASHVTRHPTLYLFNTNAPGNSTARFPDRSRAARHNTAAQPRLRRLSAPETVSRHTQHPPSQPDDPPILPDPPRNRPREGQQHTQDPSLDPANQSTLDIATIPSPVRARYPLLTQLTTDTHAMAHFLAERRECHELLGSRGHIIGQGDTALRFVTEESGSWAVPESRANVDGGGSPTPAFCTDLPVAAAEEEEEEEGLVVGWEGYDGSGGVDFGDDDAGGFHRARSL